VKIVLLILLLFLPACEDKEGKGYPVGDFALVPLDKIPLLEPKHLAQGKVSIVNFWASWCVPCRAEHPFLMTLAKGKTPIFGIAYSDEPKNAVRFLRTLGNPFLRVGLDREGYTALGWGIKGVPETFVLDGKGRIIFHHRGPLVELTEIRRVLKQAQP
jgi:cytochrome c biogenesis protein CcmG/thiol:disulfide interchange protein DsbE